MVTLTSMAVEKVKEYMAEQEENDISLRVMIAGMGCGGPQYMMSLDDEVSENDITVEQEGLKVVFDSETAPMMDGSEIDYVETLEKSGFTVNNPNFQSGGGGGCGGNCACGNGG